jgi:hypothetical protein
MSCSDRERHAVLIGAVMTSKATHDRGAARRSNKNA